MQAMGRPEVYFASSVSPEFDGRRTIIEAIANGADGVQLFLDPRYREQAFRKEVTQRLVGQKLGVIWHLPNTPTNEDISAMICLAGDTGQNIALIHHLPATELPQIKGIRIGWENSIIGYFPEHLETTKEMAERDGTFLVYDVLRMCYPSPTTDHENIIRYIRESLTGLPEGTYLHLADKKTLGGKFRDEECALGDGIATNFLDLLRSFKGVIVLEHENLDLAIKTLSRLRY